MTTKRTLTMIGLVTVVAALAVVAWRSAERADRTDSVASASTTAGAATAAPAERVANGESPARAPLTMDQLFAEGRAKISDPAAKHDEATTAPPSPSAPAEAPTALDQELEATLASDPVLRRFYNLRKKALRSKLEQAEYQALLADESLIEEAKAELAEGYSAEALDQTEELRRLQRLQYLNAALAWTDNPARAAALTSIETLLLAEIPTGLPKAVRGSLMGDKFDLYQHLMLAEPERAKALLALASGTGSEKVLELAHRTGASAN